MRGHYPTFEKPEQGLKGSTWPDPPYSAAVFTTRVTDNLLWIGKTSLVKFGEVSGKPSLFLSFVKTGHFRSLVTCVTLG